MILRENLSYMYKASWVLLFSFVVAPAYSQVQELETFRKKIRFFITYDKGKSDSIPKTEANTLKLRQGLEESFKQFILQNKTESLESLKGQSRIKSGNSYTFDQASYSLSESYRDYTIRTRKNNINYGIGLSGLYNYNQPNFVQLFIQPFATAQNLYSVYSFDLNGEGFYYIKDSATNKICYRGESKTSQAPIHKLRVLDDKHILIVENMGDLGQRAIVLETSPTQWKPIEAFAGKAIDEKSGNLRQMQYKPRRLYMRLAANRSILINYGSRYLTLDFDEQKKVLFYKQFVNESKGDIRVIESPWKGRLFVVDDYYLGEHLSDADLPMP